MASVYEKNGSWYLRVKDVAGRWKAIRSEAKTKTEARRLADDYARKAERQHLGLDPLPTDPSLTVEKLLRWWLKNYSEGTPSHGRRENSVRKHLLSGELAALPVVALRPGHVETFLQQKKREGLAPQTLNHLRGHLHTAINAARRAEQYTGPNPVSEVRRRRVPKRKPSFLEADEVPRMLAEISPCWRPLFATAVYTGLRKGELIGLRKKDVDLKRRLLTVERSYERDTTKGGHSDVIPIAAELEPYLRAALRASSSQLLFPRSDGSMHREDIHLEDKLRRALGRAGLVELPARLSAVHGEGHAARGAPR